jgi:hypothetical protein
VLTRAGAGVFRLDAIDLVPAGAWRLELEALVSDFEKATAATTIPIGSGEGER